MAINESYILSDSDIAGSFDFITYNIFIFEDDNSFIKKIKDIDDPLSFEESVFKYSVLLHEYRHYYDMTHTVYGFDYLYTLNEALSQNFNMNSGDEFNYYKVKKFSNDLKKIRYPKYYNLLFKEDNSKKWQLIPTIGKVFDSQGFVSNRPILFARYYDEDNNILCRHPFSMVSLLECSATLDEYLTSISVIMELLSDKPANKDLLIKKFEEKSLNYIYDINLTEYSTCFHMIANHFRITELQDLFHISRILLDICFNFTDSHFEALERHNLVDGLFSLNPLWDESQQRDYIDFITGLKRGIEHKERPILFYVLLHLINNKINTDSRTIILELNKILGNCHLSVSKIFEDARTLIHDQANIVKNSKIEYFSLIANSVNSNLNILKNDGDVEKYFKVISECMLKLDLPMFETFASFHGISPPKKGFFEGVNYKENFDKIMELKAWVDQFDEACFF